MNELLNKSELGMLAAETLEKEGLYNHACHPMYYSCLQLAMHKLECAGIPIENQSALASAKYDGKSHRCLIYESADKVKLKTCKSKLDYIDDFKLLKDMRERADYKKDIINQSEFANGMEIAKIVISEIKSI